MKTVDAAAWDAQRRRLDEHERREAQQVSRARDAVVAGAMREGRITRPQAQTYRKAMDVDPEGTADTLAALPPNKVPVREIGTGAGDTGGVEVGGSPDDAMQDDYQRRYFPSLRG